MRDSSFFWFILKTTLTYPESFSPQYPEAQREVLYSVPSLRYPNSTLETNYQFVYCAPDKLKFYQDWWPIPPSQLKDCKINIL